MKNAEALYLEHQLVSFIEDGSWPGDEAPELLRWHPKAAVTVLSSPALGRRPLNGSFARGLDGRGTGWLPLRL